MCEKQLACPRCHGTRWERLQWPHWQVVLWVLNPGPAFNELVFGQRLPKRTLICQDCEEPRCRRQWVPCPHCGTLHNGMIWAYSNAFGNWLGLVCPACRQRIPCLWNWTSLLVLALTSPLWWWPYRYYFRDRPASPPKLLPTFSKWETWREGLILGLFLFMWCLMSGWSYWHNYLCNGQLPKMEDVFVMVVLGMVMGTFFGVRFYRHLKRPQKKK